MNKNRITLWTLGLTLCGLCACSEVAITGRSQLNFMPDSMMSSMSLQHYQTFLKENKTSTDAQQTERVKRVGRRIAQAITDYCRMRGIQSELQGYDWEFNLVDSNDINAWAMPGGKVVVYTSVDEVFAEPICKQFEQETGIKVELVPDTEETKSAGLLNRLIAEKNRPRADVFWSGDPVRAAMLKAKGVSTPYRSSNVIRCSSAGSPLDER